LSLGGNNIYKMTAKDTFFQQKQFINIGGKLLDISQPMVMGIVNVTPDSFYATSRVETEKQITEKAEKILLDGGKIIDVGAYSTRPSAKIIDEATEMERLKVALRCIRENFEDAIISLDTFRASVAKWAVENYKVNIINDVSGGNLDENMFSTIASLKVPYILMHMRGTPATMQQLTHYKDVVNDVVFELSEKVQKLRLLGVNDIIIDPGFGFAKTIEQNYHLLSHLEVFKYFELPLLVGISRKSMIYKLLDQKPEDSLNGTTVLNTIALSKGAKILRVHDVKEAVETIKIYQQVAW
jgi:dihydropteroate synthase